MPSPVGHALGAIAVGLAVTPAAQTTRARWIQLGLLAAIGVAPDLDLLIGRHRLESHSLGLAVIVGALAALLRWPIARSRLAIFLAAFAAWFSHPILDYLGADTSRPYGVMIWWPFSSTYYYAGLSVLMPISRRWWLPRTYTHNLLAAAREVLLLGPMATLGLWWRWPRGEKT